MIKGGASFQVFSEMIKSSANIILSLVSVGCFVAPQGSYFTTRW